ncbi:FAD-dependent monooxygenase [Streptomyces sp. TRM 70361]|uniref:FAD-dependent monooxygenase n=1 Tax=Streptomyces sp. TRM 70361 TaxID=3116553 RepID=UPI002E7AC522|nr:FAD-dependent monooxygenase [Streptomyces sp. TRM 70361]MEE1940078.1 FAD-dependent monooxygenase [Streptomyces sp. TRM 70361]
MPTVVVAGAGPTGLALACGLRAAGISVRVVDKAREPSVTSRALGLQPRGLEVLDRLGALDGLPQRSLPVRQTVLHADGEPVARLRFGRRTSLVTRPALLVSQAEVEARLRQRLAELGTEVEWDRELLAADQDGEGVTVRLPDERLRAGWLVGCDGAHSRVRKAAGIDFPGVPVVERFLLADVRVALPLPRDAVSVWLSADRMIGVFPLPGTDLWRLMAPAPAGTGDDTGTGTDAVLAALLGVLRDQAGLAGEEVRETLWTSTFRIHRRLASTYRRARILLGGDAAHIHSPFGGQGLNTGLGDAENLAWKLALVATGRAHDALLDTYQAERRPVAEGVLKSTSAATRLVVGENPPARMARDRLFAPLLNRPLVQRLVWEEMSQLKVSYRRGPLASRRLRTAATPRPRAGDRVPDLECVREDGGRTRLHPELGARWALVAPAAAAADLATAARRRLGETNTAVLVPVAGGRRALLVRPDGHLAWSGTSPATLDRWLARVLGDGHVR